VQLTTSVECTATRPAPVSRQNVDNDCDGIPDKQDGWSNWVPVRNSPVGNCLLGRRGVIPAIA